MMVMGWLAQCQTRFSAGRRGNQRVEQMQEGPRLLCHQILGIDFGCAAVVLFPLGRSEVLDRAGRPSAEGSSILISWP